MVLPEPVANTEWAQSGGNATKSMAHVALGQISEPFDVLDIERLAKPMPGSQGLDLG